MKFLKISDEEKKVQLAYLLVFWITFSTLFIVLFFQDYEVGEVRGKEIVMEEINQKNKILAEQKLNLAHIDSLGKMLSNYNPENKLVYLESSINHELSEMLKAYQKKKDDRNYKIYMQANTFYNMLYYDKKAVWHAMNNTNFLKKNLEECEVGFQQAQNNINLQEALKNNNPTP